MHVRSAFLLFLFLVPLSAPCAGAQSDPLVINSKLVLVPALVKSHDGERVYMLQAQDFTLLDNGIPQTLHLEEESGREPLALAIVVQTGGLSAAHLKDYRRIETFLEDMIGEVPHTVAVIGFDSTPSLVLGFTESIPKAADAIGGLESGDKGAAILDAAAFGIQQLSALPLRYRRAILLLSETFDNGSQISLDNVVRAVGDKNVTIYSLAFSSARADAAHRAGKLPGGSYSHTPYAPGGCMSRAPEADPDAHGNRAIQAWDCAGDLLPPLRIGELALAAAKNGLRRNVPQTLTRLTGGEFFDFNDAKSLAARMAEIRNDLPNRYLLSFQPSMPSPGPHALRLEVPTQPKLLIEARTTYWIDDEK